jgi:hypothetical protein
MILNPPTLGIIVDSEIDLSTRYGKVRVFINKTLSTETTYQQGLTVGKLGQCIRYWKCTT